jgi:hemerythrin-like metal-binding protein
MPQLQWTPDMSVGVASLDEDHRFMLGLLNDLEESIAAGGGDDAVTSILDALLDYTGYHFEREEAMMRAAGYPDVETHAHTHWVLKTQVTHIRERFIASPGSIHDREVLAFLRNWLTSHIMGRDKLYAPFVAARSEAVERVDRDYQERRKQAQQAVPAAPA